MGKERNPGGVRSAGRLSWDEGGEPGEALAQGAAVILGRPLGDVERTRLERYVGLLQGWGRTMRLVGRLDREWIERVLLLDSLLFLKVVPRGARRVMDLGSGAGVPGVPLRIVSDQLEMTLVESRRRRASFLRAVVRELELKGTDVVPERAEQLAGRLAGTFDAVVARCAGDAGRTLRLALEFVRPGGVAVVAGPPAEARLAIGSWVTVAAPLAGPPRRFAIAQR